MPRPPTLPPAAATSLASALPAAPGAPRARCASGPPPARSLVLGLAAALVLASLAGCGSAPRGPAARSGGAPAGGWPERDGPGDNPPPNLTQVPDAEPRVEPLRTGGPNKPYTVLGQSYTPHSSDVALRERGLASWYGRKFHGKPTSNGEVYDMYAMTAAHRTMPLPSYARVHNPANGRSVVVRVNDRGPFHPDRVIDLSYTAALKLGVLGGVAPVEVERITHEAIRSGSWRWPEAGAVALPTPALPTVRSGPAPPAAPMPRPDPAPAAPLARADTATPSTGPAASSPVTEPATPVAGATTPAPGFWLQFGAFRERAGADSLRQRLAQEAGELAGLLALVSERGLHRVQAGPYTSRSDALQAAERLAQRLQPPPVLVERR